MIININTKKKYTVEIGENLLNDIGYKVSKLTSPKSKVCIITDVNVDKLYMHRLEESLTNQSFFIHKLVFESGENIKNINSLERILNYLSHEHFNKGDIIIAFGGGMIGDLAGFAASVYHRGIPYIQIPTTLLAAVDSSIGGKTAINLSSGKNTIGNLWNPTAVYFDIKTLETLEKKELQNGISEIIKAAIIGDKYLFELFEKNSPKNLANFIFEALVRAIYVKKKIIEIMK